VLVDVAVDLARLEQVVVGASGGDAPGVDHDDLVRERDRRQAVSDDQRRPAFHRLAQAEPDPTFRGRVHRSGCVVEDQDARVDGDRPGDREPLPLAAGQRDPALADHRVEALRQAFDELVRLGKPGHVLDFFVAQARGAEGDVLADRGREEERVLGDRADLTPERAELHVPHIGAVDRDASGSDVVEARHERGQRRLARARVSDQRDRLTGRYVEVDALEHGASRHVLEPDPFEADVAAPGRELAGAGPIGHLLGLVDHLEDALTRGGRPLRLPDPHPQRAKRHDQQPEVEVEGDEAADRQFAGGDHSRADEQHCRLSDERHPRDQRDIEGTLPVRLDRLVEDRLGPGLELLALARLLCERLDDVDADDVLLGDGCDVGELLLDLPQRRVRDVAVAIREDDQHGRDRERDQRQLPLEEQQHPGDEDDGEDVLEEEDQAVAEKEPHALEVDGRP